MAPSYRSRLIAEFIGTFFFFFLGFSGIAASVDLPGSISSAGVAAGFGLGLALAIFAFGHISGGHYNPAVTLGLAIGRQFPAKEVLGYWLAQFIGGVCAAGLAASLHSEKVQNALGSSPGDTPVGKAFVIEAVGTFLFVMLISAVATDKRAPWYGDPGADRDRRVHLHRGPHDGTVHQRLVQPGALAGARGLRRRHRSVDLRRRPRSSAASSAGSPTGLCGGNPATRSGTGPRLPPRAAATATISAPAGPHASSWARVGVELTRPHAVIGASWVIVAP